jgi:nitroreductase
MKNDNLKFKNILSSRNLNKSNSDPALFVERAGDQIGIATPRRPSPFDKGDCPKGDSARAKRVPIWDIIKERRSIRKFQRKEIPEKIIDKLITALIWAPSAGNLQSRKFYFVFNQEIKEKLVKAAFGQDFIGRAPLVIVGCSDDKISWRYGERGKNLYSICDVAASIQNMMLLAHSENLGSVWVGAFEEKEVAKILNLPDNLRPIVIVPVGYPAEKPLAPARVSKAEATVFKK